MATVYLMVLVVGIHGAAISNQELENLAEQLLCAVSVNNASQRVSGKTFNKHICLPLGNNALLSND